MELVSQSACVDTFTSLRCGFLACITFSSLKRSIPSQALKKDLGDQAEQVGKKIDWLTFKDLESSVREDVQIIKQSPLIPDNITVHGFIYNVSLCARIVSPTSCTVDFILRLSSAGESCDMLLPSNLIDFSLSRRHCP